MLYAGAMSAALPFFSNRVACAHNCRYICRAGRRGSPSAAVKVLPRSPWLSDRRGSSVFSAFKLAISVASTALRVAGTASFASTIWTSYSRCSSRLPTVIIDNPRSRPNLPLHPPHGVGAGLHTGLLPHVRRQAHLVEV